MRHGREYQMTANPSTVEQHARVTHCVLAERNAGV